MSRQYDTQDRHPIAHRQNRQVSMEQPDTASLRYSKPNRGSGTYTVTPGGGVALAGGLIVDQITPVAGTIIKRSLVLWG
jgi:hypothetical protein